jgi:chromosome segregation ATPase
MVGIYTREKNITRYENERAALERRRADILLEITELNRECGDVAKEIEQLNRLIDGATYGQ